jgi:hypothetical protein
MRNIAATLLTLSGISHIALLWFRDISGTALAGALFGALYLIIGIGLYGQSRFTLFVAIAIPGMGAWLALANSDTAPIGTLGGVHLAISLVVICFSAVILIAVRNNPSV